MALYIIDSFVNFDQPCTSPSLHAIKIIHRVQKVVSDSHLHYSTLLLELLCHHLGHCPSWPTASETPTIPAFLNPEEYCHPQQQLSLLPSTLVPFFPFPAPHVLSPLSPCWLIPVIHHTIKSYTLSTLPVVNTSHQKHCIFLSVSALVKDPNFIIGIIF